MEHRNRRRARCLELNYIEQILRRPRSYNPPLIPDRKHDFAYQLLNLKKVSPYLEYVSLHFRRNVKRVLNHSNFFLDVGMEWISIMPNVLIDHDFESAKHAAFAINLKNMHDNEVLKPYLKYELLTDVMFLPQGFEELVNVCDGINYSFMDVGRVVLRGDYSFMKMMVKYGVLRPNFQMSSNYMLTDYLMWLFYPNGASYKNLKEDVEAAVNGLLTYDKVRDQGRETELFRLQTVTSVIPVLFKQDPPYNHEPELYENILDCIRLYFEAVPEPFVSLLEIFRLLNSFLETRKYVSIGRRAGGFKLYRAAFPDCDYLQPRALKHLSRCALRKSLCEIGQLPVVISKLPVPQSIKDYIQIV